MDDEKVRQLLGRYQPVGPASDLRTRVLPPSFRAARTWPWVAAAAVLLTATVAIHLATTSAIRRIAPPPVDPMSALAAAMGGDEEARSAARLIVAEQSIRGAVGQRDMNDELEALINASR